MKDMPGDRPLNGLSGSEVTTICNDLTTFLPQEQADTCRLSGFLSAALSASFDSTATDAALQATCTQATGTCMSSLSTASCGAPPADCAATVGEFTACLNDATAQNHMLAAGLPDCSSVTRASISAHPDVLGAALSSTQPASCQTYGTKCPAGMGTSTSPTDGGATD